MVNLLISALSGLLLSTAFAPLSLWFAAPFAVALHIFAIDQSQKKLLSALVFALAFNLNLLHWTSIYVGSTPWIILAIGLSLLYLPLALTSRWGIASYPFIFIAMEQVRNIFPFGGFGWARLAYSQADAPYAKIASYGGAAGLSACVVLLALLIYFVFNKKLPVLIIAPLLLLTLPLNVTEASAMKVLLIQGNVPNYGLDFNARAKAVFYNHVSESNRTLAQFPNVDFLLWPENAVDVDPFQNKDVNDELNSFSKPLILGAIVNKGGQNFNSSILWSNKQQIIYNKQHLTPFGEYIPLRSLATKISPLANQVSDFTPGDSQVIFKINSAKIVPVICYELIDDSLLESAANSANLIVVQTNSATFGMSAESAQQLSITRIRAIEHSRNILSVSTTGYSAVIDHSGKIIKSTKMGVADHLYAEVGLIDQLSMRDRLGDWALIITLIWLLLVARRSYVYRR